MVIGIYIVVSLIVYGREDIYFVGQTKQLLDITCKAQHNHELKRDKYFSSLKKLPSPFPIQIFEQNVLTPKTCFSLQNWGIPDSGPKIIFHIEVYKDLPMVKRTMRRLTHLNHAFMIHLASDVSYTKRQNITKWVEKQSSPLCVVEGGYVVYKSSTDMEIIMTSMVWLLQHNTTWDFFISLSGADYPLLNVDSLRQRIQSEGNRSWSVHKAMNKNHKNMERFYMTRLTCRQTRQTKLLTGHRKFWLKTLVPDFIPQKGYPLSSGGIFHRSMVKFLVSDDRARAAYMYFRLFPVAGVEHYWQTIYSLEELKNNITASLPCEMSWDEGREYDGTHNTFLTEKQWRSIIAPALKKRTPFIRKFNSIQERKVLNRIDMAQTW